MQKKDDFTPSLATEILRDYKKDNQILKGLLLISILVNIVVAFL